MADALLEYVSSVDGGTYGRKLTIHHGESVDSRLLGCLSLFDLILGQISSRLTKCMVQVQTTGIANRTLNIRVDDYYGRFGMLHTQCIRRVKRPGLAFGMESSQGCRSNLDNSSASAGKVAAVRKAQHHDQFSHLPLHHPSLLFFVFHSPV